MKSGIRAVEAKMALARKGSRLIHVGERSYRWTVSERGDLMAVVVEASPRRGRRLNARFPMRAVIVEVDEFRRLVVQRDIITPALVRRTILEGLSQGWKPDEPGATLSVTLKGQRPAQSIEWVD